MARLQTAIATALAAALSAGAAATAQAQQKQWAVNSTACFGATSQTLSTAKGAPMGMYHLSGVTMSADTSYPLHGASVECFGVYSPVAGVPDSSDRCVLVDRDGDRAWGIGRHAGDENTFSYTGGTGKYVGVTGTNQRRTTWAKPSRDGHGQGCTNSTGTLTLK